MTDEAGFNEEDLMSYTPKHLELWTCPKYYIGSQWDEYYSFLSVTRDSDTLSRSNFQVAQETLMPIAGEGEPDECGVQITRANHFLCGWVDTIYIHKDSPALEEADKMAGRLENYPVLCEHHWSALEHEENHSYWERCSLSDRVYQCQRANVSIFAARHIDRIPDEVYDRLCTA